MYQAVELIIPVGEIITRYNPMNPERISKRSFLHFQRPKD
jgi:hypothetical protein